jgi:hypothetical protein
MHEPSRLAYTPKPAFILIFFLLKLQATYRLPQFFFNKDSRQYVIFFLQNLATKGCQRNRASVCFALKSIFNLFLIQNT